MRSLMRHRNYLVMMASEHIRHMQKALTQMNVQLQHVISDITGLTGLAILDAVVAGARDPSTLATRPGRRRSANRWKATGETSTSRPGNNACTCIEPIDPISECDKEIEKLVAAFEPRVDPDESPCRKIANRNSTRRISTCAKRPTSFLAETSPGARIWRGARRTRTALGFCSG